MSRLIRPDPETAEVASVRPAEQKPLNHFVAVKNTGDVVLVATLANDDPAVIDRIVWEGDGVNAPAVEGTKLTAKLPTTAAGKTEVRIKLDGQLLWTGVVWVIWAELAGAPRKLQN